MKDKIIKDKTAQLRWKENADRTVRFYREQLVTQVECLASQVNELDDSQVLSRDFHDKLNKALYELATIQGLYGGNHSGLSEDDIPF
jgi:hypothetical protein